MARADHEQTFDGPPFRVEALPLLIRRRTSDRLISDAALNVRRAVEAGASVAELERAMAGTPVLSMTVMRAARAAAFGVGPIDSLAKAIEVVGYDRLSNLVFAMVVDGYVARRYEAGSHVARLQRRLMALAAVSSRLGQRCAPGTEDARFLEGLMQDIGLFFLAVFASDSTQMVANTLSKTPGARLCDVERYYYNTDHIEVGLMIADEFQLPENVKDVIRHHHSPSLASGLYQSAVDMANVASGLASGIGCPPFAGADHEKMDPFALDRIGLATKDLETIGLEAMRDASSLLDTLGRGPRWSGEE